MTNPKAISFFCQLALPNVSLCSAIRRHALLRHWNEYGFSGESSEPIEGIDKALRE
jgi:hypothetical protein